MTDSAKGHAPILAAGGVVLRGMTRPRIAVVRLRREKAWVLPKGKLLPREHPRDAAVREVTEETGYDVSVHELLGSMSYVAEARLKIVQFWLMRASGRPVHALADDVKQVKWLDAAASYQGSDPGTRKGISEPCRPDRTRGRQTVDPREEQTRSARRSGPPRTTCRAGRARHCNRFQEDPSESLREGARQLDRAHQPIGRETRWLTLRRPVRPLRFTPGPA